MTAIMVIVEKMYMWMRSEGIWSTSEVTSTKDNIIFLFKVIRDILLQYIAYVMPPMAVVSSTAKAKCSSISYQTRSVRSSHDTSGWYCRSSRRC